MCSDWYFRSPWLPTCSVQLKTSCSGSPGYAGKREAKRSEVKYYVQVCHHDNHIATRGMLRRQEIKVEWRGKVEWRREMLSVRGRETGEVGRWCSETGSNRCRCYRLVYSQYLCLEEVLCVWVWNNNGWTVLWRQTRLCAPSCLTWRFVPFSVIIRATCSQKIHLED